VLEKKDRQDVEQPPNGARQEKSLVETCAHRLNEFSERLLHFARANLPQAAALRTARSGWGSRCCNVAERDHSFHGRISPDCLLHYRRGVGASAPFFRFAVLQNPKGH